MLAALGAVALGGLAPRAEGRGRSPVGGRVMMHVPWPLGAIDPHRLDDATSAIFGDALFDTLYARNESGVIVASLAEAEPELEPTGAQVRVTVRAGIKTARGRTINVRDVVESMARARANGARAWLADIPPPRVEGRNALIFPLRDASKVLRAFSSPLTAIVPSGFSPSTPDGTGPFRIEPRGDGIALVRNPIGARGPALLDEIVVRPAPDLTTSLRAFETSADDVGWLGIGLHEPRPGARTFDAGLVGWALLVTGRDVLDWDAPGIAQRVCDDVPHARLAYLGIGPPWTSEATAGWGGPPATIIVRDDSPWLMELARVVAAFLTRPSHEVVVKPVTSSELAARRATRNFPLAVDFARPLALGPLGALATLTSADNPTAADDLVRHPPRLAEVPARTLTRTLRIGVLGEVRVQGGRVPDLNLAQSASTFGADWGASSRARRP
jgi:peptide/nickel transport system substrate-binding protein